MLVVIYDKMPVLIFFTSLMPIIHLHVIRYRPDDTENSERKFRPIKLV